MSFKEIIQLTQKVNIIIVKSFDCSSILVAVLKKKRKKLKKVEKKEEKKVSLTRLNVLTSSHKPHTFSSLKMFVIKEELREKAYGAIYLRIINNNSIHTNVKQNLKICVEGNLGGVRASTSSS